MSKFPAIFLKPDAPLSNNLFPNGIPVSYQLPLLANANDQLLWSVPVDRLTVIQMQAIAIALAKWQGVSIDQVNGLAVEKQLFGIPNQWFLLLFGEDMTQAEAEVLARSARIVTELANSTKLYCLSIPTGSGIMLCLVLTMALYAPGMPPPPVELTEFYKYLSAKLPTELGAGFSDESIKKATEATLGTSILLDIPPYTVYLIVSALGDFSLVSEQPEMPPLIAHIVSPLRQMLLADFPKVAAIILSEEESTCTN